MSPRDVHTTTAAGEEFQLEPASVGHLLSIDDGRRRINIEMTEADVRVAAETFIAYVAEMDAQQRLLGEGYIPLDQPVACEGSSPAMDPRDVHPAGPDDNPEAVRAALAAGRAELRRVHGIKDSLRLASGRPVDRFAQEHAEARYDAETDGAA